VQRSEGDASRFRQVLVEYQKAPAVTRDRLYLDMMQSVLGSTSKVVIDQKPGSGGNLLYLPLDRLIQQAAPAAPAATLPAEVSPSTPAPRAAPAEIPPQVGDGPRGREALRARER